MKSDGTYLEINGTFSFSINQHGLDYYDKEERQHAIEDFWNEFASSQENTHRDCIDIQLDWDEDDLIVEPGE